VSDIHSSRQPYPNGRGARTAPALQSRPPAFVRSSRETSRSARPERDDTRGARMRPRRVSQRPGPLQGRDADAALRRRQSPALRIAAGPCPQPASVEAHSLEPLVEDVACDLLHRRRRAPTEALRDAVDGVRSTAPPGARKPLECREFPRGERRDSNRRPPGPQPRQARCPKRDSALAGGSQRG
jgi:hypothetical protein